MVNFIGMLILQAATAVLAAPPPKAIQLADAKISELADKAFAQSELEASENLEKRSAEGTCTWDKISFRREWGDLTKKERKSYIDAVKCLQAKPARYPSDVAPGAKSRFDDYVATHINQTNTIHYTGNFLSWHRYYVWLYEQALRDECGYEGYQPYWDWTKTAVTGLNCSPLFDGSETSLSGDGVFIPDREELMLGKSQGLPPIYLPVGTGGGCVKSGPFKDMLVNLGPVALDEPGGEVSVNPNGPFAHNPRCLKRDLTTEINRRYANATSVLNNIVQPQNIMDFQMQMQGVPGQGDIGIHGGPHYALGGDPARDVFTSPGDPAFYFHHAMVDRVWWIWQMLDPANRRDSDKAIAGTNTFLDNPPSANTTLDDYVSFDFAAGPPKKIKDLMSTISGPFCYVYL